MPKRLNKQLKESIKSRIESKHGIREVAKYFKVSTSTVHKLSKTCKKNISINGRPKKLSPTTITHCVTQITRGNTKNATELAKSLKRQSNISVSRQTVARALMERGLKSKEKKEKPFLRAKNVKERLKFAKVHEDWTEADWRQVIYSDETKINRFGSDGRVWSWCRDEDPLLPQNVKQTIKHGGGNIKIWGCMAANGVGGMCKIDSILDSQLYLQILQVELAETFKDLHMKRHKSIFQHDNDPKHTAIIIKEYLKTQKYETMIWPAQSPDLNPIEHLWKHLKTALYAYEMPAKGMLELWDRIQKEWLKVDKATCSNLIDSMPRRMKAVIRAKGYWTKY
jgi:transposase